MSLPQWGSPQARSVQTTIPCHHCGQPLIVQRACRTVALQCAACEKNFPLQEYIREMDSALEKFMENVYCDRI